MLILNLTRGDSGIRVPLHLPATPADVGDVYAKLDQISKKEKLTRIASVVSDSKFLERYFRDKTEYNGKGHSFCKGYRSGTDVDGMG